MSYRRGIAALGALAIGGSALAQGKDAPPAIVQSLETCRAIDADAERLACFDRVSTELAAAVAKKELVVLDRKQVRETRKGLFGFTLPRLPWFRGDDSAQEEPSEIQTTVTASSDLGNGEWRLQTADAGVWRTTEASKGLPPKPGTTITVVRGALGRYFVQLKSGRRYTARRIS